MTNIFLAEDFRKLMDALDGIQDGEESKSQKHTDVDDLMQVERPEDISKDSIEDVNDLIEYLDQFPELDQWRNDNAKYDDAFYEGVPMDRLQSVADLDQDGLDEISSKFKEYAGAVVMKDGKISIYGES